MRFEGVAWFVSAILAVSALERRAVTALPHVVVPEPGTTEALSLTLFVKSSLGDAHFVAVPSSAKVPPAAVTADMLVAPSLNDAFFKDTVAKHGSFPVRASERSAYVIDGLAAGQAYDVFFVIEAANSNGLYSPVGRVLGVSTNTLAPSISSLSLAPVDARTNATQLSLSMDATGVPCRVWYAIQPLQDSVLLEVENFSAEEIVEAALPDSVVDLRQGLKGVRSPLPINDGLESDTWYQVSAVSERAEGVYSQPVYAVAKTHREPARVLDWKATPVHGSTDSLSLLTRLDCSAAPTHEACGILRYEVTEKPPKGSPESAKPRQVAQGTAVVADGRLTPHVVSGLSPGKAHSISMAIETPSSNGAYGPTMEVAATTFPRAPRLVKLDAARSATEASTVTVRYKLSEEFGVPPPPAPAAAAHVSPSPADPVLSPAATRPEPSVAPPTAAEEAHLCDCVHTFSDADWAVRGLQPGVVHVSLVERVGHPLALIGTMIGNQHGVGFSLEVGMSAGDDEEVEGSDAALEGSQEVHDLSAGSAFEVTAHTESTLLGRQSSVYGEAQARVIEAVPPLLARVRLVPPDATTIELLLEYEVMQTAGRMYYALCEVEAADKGEKESLTNSAETVKSAKEGAGVVAVGSLSISPEGGSGSIQKSGKNEHGDGYNHAELSPGQQLRFRDLQPRKRYVVSLCTESNSGTLSKVTVSEAQTHAEAPLVTEVTAMPADRSAEALSLAVALESSGLVHFAVRRAADGLSSVATRDHTIVYRGTREVNGTSSSSSVPQQQLPRGDATANAGVAAGGVFETVEGLEPNATYEIFIATETTNSNGVYHANSEPVLATTHPVPPILLEGRAQAADASSSALVVTVSLASLAEVHYAVFPIPARHDQDGRGQDTATAAPVGDERAFNGEADGEVLTREGGGGGGGADGACSGNGWGSRNGSGGIDGRRDPTALNETLGLVASGVIPSAATAAMLLSAAEEDGAKKPAEVSTAGAAAATAIRSNGQPNLMAASRSLEGSGLEVMFRVEGLRAAQAYSVCLFTETPNSNGLFGDVHELRPVSTHAPVPELALEKIACSVDCPGLNRDPCWLEANKCGECVDGFDGKAGHVNSPCGKVASLTEDDIARITDRERQKTSEGEQADQFNEDPQIGNHSGDKPKSDVAPPESSTTLVADGGDSNKGIGLPAAAPSQSRLLMGVPVAMGPNLTKFLYVEVPEDNGTGNKDGFDVEKTAARLCEELHTEGDEGKLPACLTSLAVALKSRFDDGRFHREDDPQRPVLQVEVDAPGGESLAFTLRHGEEEGIAVVGFCRDNEGVLPDEQACVVTLMQEISL